ncbi:hypothetical protein KL930_005401 [Ogataea haglerorum]|uniref:Uncharacterized protein n=1 Tax=Ogataea haglerorum TaxID=1937702 RepID=A0ABQ7REK7_9ASCO|nr:hypothetical protein KL914_003359 [Ogataea haglerorum]KAG7743480.1 hypothetical protein KL932_002221 [Ogataea haglerorum]KAG7764329.1 hypothetical protein KL946_003009 [Ogataea haglerorum]KAG7771643.1 hypothetical protein KL930_005401 [Ogataea haglerorum]KAG7773259.1 hypothetical protein KL922_005406 [Ogataea haglerorum]
MDANTDVCPDAKKQLLVQHLSRRICQHVSENEQLEQLQLPDVVVCFERGVQEPADSPVAVYLASDACRRGPAARADQPGAGQQQETAQVLGDEQRGHRAQEKGAEEPALDNREEAAHQDEQGVRGPQVPGAGVPAQHPERSQREQLRQLQHDAQADDSAEHGRIHQVSASRDQAAEAADAHAGRHALVLPEMAREKRQSQIRGLRPRPAIL